VELGVIEEVSEKSTVEEEEQIMLGVALHGDAEPDISKLTAKDLNMKMLGAFGKSFPFACTNIVFVWSDFVIRSFSFLAMGAAVRDNRTISFPYPFYIVLLILLSFEFGGMLVFGSLSFNRKVQQGCF